MEALNPGLCLLGTNHPQMGSGSPAWGTRAWSPCFFLFNHLIGHLCDCAKHPVEPGGRTFAWGRKTQFPRQSDKRATGGVGPLDKETQ